MIVGISQYRVLVQSSK